MYKELFGKRLLVLGGSTWKEAIKSFATENKITIIAAGLWRVGIFDIADECYIVDILDVATMKLFIKNHKIDGVYMGGAENVISAACQYINELGLPCYCTKEQWDFLQNKVKFKSLCQEFGLPVVPKYDVQAGDNISNHILNNAYPVILKPADGCGSNGFSVCITPGEVSDAIAHAKNCSPTGTFICEKFVNNKAIVVFYTFSNGKIYFSGSQDKYPVRYIEHGSYVGGLYLFESKFASEFRRLFEKKIENMIQSLGIKEGSAWFEVFHDKNHYYFNEVGFRYGGSVSIYPVNYFYGINQVASDIYYSLTGKSKIIGHKSLFNDNIPQKNKYAIYPIHLRPGKIAQISGIESLRQDSNIIYSATVKKIGDSIEDSGSFSQIVALIHFLANDVQEFRQTIEQIHKKVSIKDSNGNDMINKMLNVEDIKF